LLPTRSLRFLLPTSSLHVLLPRRSLRCRLAMAPPAWLAAETQPTLLPACLQGYAWTTYDGTMGIRCDGPPCQAFSVIECVKRGAAPLRPDANGNIGCGNRGKAGYIFCHARAMSGMDVAVLRC
jgi:hypothetical protein